MMDEMAKALQEKMKGYQSEMLHHFKQLLKINTVRGERLDGAPFGKGNREALAYMLDLSKHFGLRTVNLDHYIGYSEYGNGQDYICSIAHLDVVPPGDGWTFPPFDAAEKDGILYARGAGDDKPGCIVGLYALRCMKELGYQPKRKIRVIYGCAEETGMEDADYYLQSQPLPVFGFTPDSDGYDIVNAEKGRIEICLESERGKNSPVILADGGLVPNMVPAIATAVLNRTAMTPPELARLEALTAHSPDCQREDRGSETVLTFQGISAHAAMPEGGRNAIAAYARFVSEVLEERTDVLTSFIHTQIDFDWSGTKLGLACSDSDMGDLTLNVGVLRMEEDRIRATVDIRYPTSVNAQTIQSRLEEALAGKGISLRVLSAADGHRCVCPEKFSVLREVCLDLGKPEPQCKSISGGTYAKKFKGRLVAFGGCGGSVHAPDEFVPIADFYDHADVVCYALYRLSRG